MFSQDANRILLVEDDQKLSQVVKEYLEANGFEVATEFHGDKAAERITAEVPDLVILDVMLPGKDGLTVCKEVRPHYHGPILMLTARGEEIDEIIGLEVGADDYLGKPVKPRLLLTRINALLRRTLREANPVTPLVAAAPADQAKRIMLGPVVIDAGNRSVQIRNKSVELTTAEFDLLWLLAVNRGEILSRDQIYTQLRGIDYDGLDRSIDLRIARLRKKLGDDGKQPQLIKSIRGSGYLLVNNP